jgi:prevent-host-death family protein
VLALKNLVLNTKILKMDRAISASEANQHFSELLRDVSEGESFTVMSRGRAVARVLPVDRVQEQRSVDRLLDYVESLPVRHSGHWSRADLYE